MARRADNHDGSCREILTGKLKGRWRVQFRYENEQRQKLRNSRVFATKTEAKEFLQNLRRGERIATARKERELTLGEWFDWLAENDWPEAIAEVTIAYRRGRFRKYVEKPLGSLPLTKINAIDIRAYYRKLRSQGVSDSLLQEIRADLVRTFNQAIAPYQRVPSWMANPFRLPLQTPAPRSAVALTPDEVKAAIRCRDLTEGHRAMLAVLLLAGLRLGEMMALTKGQLRLDEGLIVIDRAVHVSYGGKQTVGLPKGGKTRNVVMCGKLNSILTAFVSDCEPEDYLWSAATENIPRMKKLVYATWRTIKKTAKLPEAMSPHDCRLTHINLIEKLMPNVSTTTLKEHIGHAASGVTEANYTRPLSTAQAILRNELDRVVGSN